MADISATFASLSSTESNNAPTGATAVGTGLDDNLRMLGALQAASRDATGWGGLKLTTVAGTNSITAVVAVQGSVTMAPTAYSTGMRFHLIPANTNTGATTLNVNSIGAKNVFFHNAACVGGELVSGIPYCVEYDGTQFHILGAIRSASVLTTEQASTSGTSIDFTSAPSWAKKVTVQFVGVSTSGTDGLIIQLGDSGGVETSGYLGAASAISSTVTTGNQTAGHAATNGSSATAVYHGKVVFTLEDAANFTWVGAGILAHSEAGQIHLSGSSKSLSAALDRVRITTTGGSNTFDAGSINVLYE
jgi:hypothetical protein